MNLNKKILSALIVSFFQINQALAYPEFDKALNFDDPLIQVSGPADKLGYGSVIRSSDSNGVGICNSTAVNYTLASIVYEPIASFTGRTIQLTPAHDIFPLWDSTVPGFALTTFGGDMTNSPVVYQKPLPTVTTVMWKGYTLNDKRIDFIGHKMNSSLVVYKDAGRFTGMATIPKQRIYRYLCKDENGATQEVYNFYNNPYNVTGTVTGCTPEKSAVVLEMDRIAQGAIENADASTLLNTKKSTFSLQCDPNIDVYVSVVDLSDLTNSSDVATLSSDSTATGVGFAITGSDGKRLRFGPDGSATNIPGQQKYFIRHSGSASGSKNNPVSTQLGFSYVRKSSQEIKPGTAKAVIGLTYSYQ